MGLHPADAVRTTRLYQITQNNLVPNTPNVALVGGKLPVESMDPTRPQDGTTDPTISYGSVSGVEVCPSYNAELFKPLSPTMTASLKKLFPTP